MRTGFARQACGEAADGAVDRRRKQHRLARRRRQRADAIDILLEAHVEHPVRFVEDQDLQSGQVDTTALDVIDQPARRGDEDVDAALELAVLRRIRRAAEQAHRAQAQVLSIARRLCRNLLRELARRGEHQHAAARRHRGAWQRGADACAASRCKRRQDERRRLAGAGLRRRDDVPSGEQQRNGLRLDRRRFVIAAFGQRLQQRRAPVQVLRIA